MIKMTNRTKNCIEDSSFEKFMLAEYDHISQAHFSTVTNITNFFKYFILIVSLPFSVFAYFVKSNSANSVATSWIKQNYISVLFVSTIVFITLLSIAGYIISLRTDALLYARTINGIRKYFYNKSGLEYKEEIHYRVLPRSTYFPPYLEKNYFIYVVMTFALLNSIVLSSGIWITQLFQFNEYVALSFCFGVAMHYYLYYNISNNRENAYLKKNSIGIDIDGVIAKHRHQFCKIYEEQNGCSIDPEQLNKMPVRNCKNLGITEEKEVSVFHNPKYWIQMPIYEEAERNIKKLSELYHYHVIIFSWRDWPIWSRLNEKSKKESLKKEWIDAYIAMTKTYSIIQVIYKEYLKILSKVYNRIIIKNITKKWLIINNIKFDKLIIEYGNTDQPYKKAKVVNRLIKSRNNRIQIFVEDDPDKACKLADICEVVFLIKHPYNTNNNYNYPNNVIMVEGWNDVLSYIKSNL